MDAIDSPILPTEEEPRRGMVPGMNFGRKRLVALVEALQPLGLNASIAQVAHALLPLRHDRWAIRISGAMLEAIIEDNRHQVLINNIIMNGLKQLGYETTYADLYPDYVAACRVMGFAPLSLKTFKNRALQRESRWQKRLKASYDQG